MEHLFNYTLTLVNALNSLIQDIMALQLILQKKKTSPLTQEKMQKVKKEVRKKAYYLRILEHVHLLDEFKNDISRALTHIDLFLEETPHTSKQVKKIAYYLSSICTKQEHTEIVSLEVEDCIYEQTCGKLSITIKVIEEILLGFYGIASSTQDLDNKLVKSIEGLFQVRVENLPMEDKLFLEEFFQQIQTAFGANTVEGWEKCYTECIAILNHIKDRHNIKIDNSFFLSLDQIDPNKNKDLDQDKEEDKKD